MLKTGKMIHCFHLCLLLENAHLYVHKFEFFSTRLLDSYIHRGTILLSLEGLQPTSIAHLAGEQLDRLYSDE